MMRRLFDEISDPARVALLRKSIVSLEKLNFHWNERYLATLTPDHGVDLVLAGVAGNQFMARSETGIFFGRTADLPEPAPERGERFTYGAKSRALAEQKSDDPGTEDNPNSR